MTAEKSSTILYLDRAALERLHTLLSAFALRNGDEPIPPISHAKSADIESVLMTPQQSFFGIEPYPTLPEKAAIIFYTINKRQIFLNGNKRMSTLCLLVFLGINEKTLNATSDELTQKALWLANTPSLAFPNIKTELVTWIREHITDMPPEEGGSVSSPAQSVQ